jgi:galactokinase
VIGDGDLMTCFEEAFEAAPELIAHAPGRINLIGEHTDYNGGFVLPAAINRDIRMAARLTGSHLTRLHSENYAARFEFEQDGSLEAVADGATGWYSFFVAVVDQFRRRGFRVPGMDVAIHGDVPLGAGLSSSAAYEVCAAVLLDHVCGAGISRKDLALLAQAAEHSPFVGVRCGIMDQFVSALGRENHALLIDCHSLSCESVPFDGSCATIVIVNSLKRRGLVDSAYNQRRRQCEEGLEMMQRLAGETFPTIRHIPGEVFMRHADSLPELVRRRLRHNLGENRRVFEFVAAMRASDFTRLGALLNESHVSLRDDFEVSCAELDTIVEIASGCNGAFGCRMTGGGFGGCAVALVEPAAVESFEHTLSRDYYAPRGLKPEVYTSPAAAGAGIRTL